jgi:glycosyltransferase involved in cell wall biosynthesis
VTPLRIALVHPYSWPATRRGAERYLADLAWFLAGAHHSVEIITGGTPARDNGAVVRTRPTRAHARLVARGITPDETFGLNAYPALVRRRYDVVHALTPSAAIAARLAGQRTVYTILGHPSVDAIGGRRGQFTLMRTAVRLAHVTTALSAASAAAAEAVFGRGVRVLAPGVRLDRFPAALEPRTGPPVVLFSADASQPQKGLDDLLLAFAELLQWEPDARLVVSGPGNPAWAFTKLGARAESVRAAVDLLGAGDLDDVPARYRNATVTVLPSRHEAFGLALVESLASGTPVVCSDSGGMPEIVDDDRIGRVVAHGDAVALAKALGEVVTLARDPDTPARCRAHAARWGWQETIGPAHEALYADLARQKPARATAR